MSVIKKIYSKVVNFWFVYSLKKKGLLKLGKNSYIDKLCRFEGVNFVRTQSSLLNVSLGYATYIGNRCVFVNAKIGRYCSIGDEVRIVRGQHPSKTFVSTHPAFFSTKSNLSYVNEDRFEEFKFVDEEKYWSLIIENDVWIGTGVKLLEGIRIGNGAIVASGAVVTKDVLPYTVVGGVPAKVISKRFDDNIINKLLNFKWWDKPHDWIKKNVDKFQSQELFFEDSNKNK